MDARKSVLGGNQIDERKKIGYGRLSDKIENRRERERERKRESGSVRGGGGTAEERQAAGG